MPSICYVPKLFNIEHSLVIDQAREICADFAEQGYDLTLRQLYYQFVAGDLFPDDWTWAQTSTGKWVRTESGTKNADPNYKKLGSIINDARLAGELDWKYIVDRTRNLESPNIWENPEAIMEAVAEQFKIDKWSDQDVRIEVWVEKDALIGILETACEPLDVPYFSCRGYTSQSEIWSAAQRLGKYIEENNQQVVILHLGDHDPSGIDMSRDIEARLSMFIAQDLGYLDPGYPPDNYIGGVEELTIDRIALNMDQIRRYNPPPNPAKLSDARGAKYVERYGSSSWELDALNPRTLAAVIQQAVKSYRDEERWKKAVDQEHSDGVVLRAASEHWDDIKTYVHENLVDD
jgi:hypothetical protein